jgi:hypothetical protein
VTALWTLYSRGPPCGGKYFRVGIYPAILDGRLAFVFSSDLTRSTERLA